MVSSAGVTTAGTRPALSISATVENDVSQDALGASLFEASEDCVKIIDLEGRLLAMNANGICLMEIDDFPAMQGQRWANLWPQAHQSAIEAALDSARSGRVARFAADCPTAKGTPRRWEVVVSPIFDELGRPARIVSISRDITDRLRVEEEHGLLARELAHRIKNMFAVVDGMIALSARATEGARPFADALRQRLSGLGRAMAYVSPPELVGRAGGDLTLHGLLHVLLAPYGDTEGDKRRIDILGEDAPVGRSATTSVALFANELATNAMKYGALAAPEGRVRLTLARSGKSLELAWEELGAGAAPPRTLGSAEGFGTVLVESAVIRQLGGRLSKEWGAEGLVVRIWLPLDRLAD